MSKTVGIVGLGLLGGSLAKALHERTDYHIIGYARRAEVCAAALDDGVVEAAYTDPESVLAEADIIVFALPPDTNAAMLKQFSYCLRPGQLITDVSSTKTNFAAAVHEILPAGVHFVSVHPMAGSEKGGYEMARADLFENCTWIVLTDSEERGWNAAAAAELTEWGRMVGSRLETLALDEHDDLLAVVSHMPHLIAAMVATVAGGDELGDLRLRLAAGGFRDITRVAGGQPSMWREIIGGNRAGVLKALAAIEEQLGELRHLLEQGDEDGLEVYLRRAKGIRDSFAAL